MSTPNYNNHAYYNTVDLIYVRGDLKMKIKAS